MCFLLDRVNVRKCSRVCLSGLTLILTAKTISWTLFIQYQLLWRVVVTACFVSMMSDWWTLGLKKKSHIISKSFIQMHPFMLSSLKVPRWIWKLLLFRFTGFSELKNQYWSRAEGGCFNKWRHFYPVHCLWKFWHYCTEPTSICFWNMA